MRKQATLVMLYGPKPPCLSTAILNCQEQIIRVLGDHFIPYDLQQIHATLISLERMNGSNLHNFYFHLYRKETSRMDIIGFIDFLRQNKNIPFQVQIGGFQEAEIPFMSQGKIPYERSFSIAGNEPAIALVVGWSIRSEAVKLLENTHYKQIAQKNFYPSILDDLRQSAQQFHILHRYYQLPTDRDNDFYFRIGLIRNLQVNPLMCRELEQKIRDILSRMEPIIVEINLSNIFLVSFQDETLPSDSTHVWSLDTVKITPAFIRSLYE